MLKKIKSVWSGSVATVLTVVGNFVTWSVLWFTVLLSWFSKLQESIVQGFQELKINLTRELFITLLIVALVTFSVTFLGALAVLQDNFVGMLMLISLVTFVALQAMYKDVEPIDVSWNLETVVSILVLYSVTVLSYMAYADRNLSAWLLVTILLGTVYLSKPDKKY